MKGSVKTKLDEEAYQRDEFECVECGKTVGLEAHHKVLGLEELNNLITLCHSCHKKQHNMAGCFTNGDDYRRDKNHPDFKANQRKGHHFFGNQYTAL